MDVSVISCGKTEYLGQETLQISKWVFRDRKQIKDRKYNGKYFFLNDENTNNDLQNTTENTND